MQVRRIVALLLLLAVGVLTSVYVYGTQRERRYRNERFIHYKSEISGTGRLEMKHGYRLHGNERFPEPDTAGFRRLEELVRRYSSVSFSVDAERRLLVAKETRAENELGVTNAQVQKVIAEYFGGTMREISPLPGRSFVGPWEITDPIDKNWKMWARLEGIGNFNAMLALGVNQSGREYVHVRAEAWEPERYHRRIQEEFILTLGATGQPEIRELRWLRPLPCDRTEPVGEHPDIWGSYIQGYVRHLPEPLSKYFRAGVARHLWISSLWPEFGRTAETAALAGCGA